MQNHAIDIIFNFYFDGFFKTVYKKLPDTTCERLPFEACAPDNCVFVPGPAQCHNKTVDIGIDKVCTHKSILDRECKGSFLAA